ncbi:MAG: phytanoyl-CoA dioxygenase family protein [Planctomycetes bacterium]|nr:phytanoyl-CoA dioxygenase family protein [Planctomycetota bacterium]
MSAATTTAAAPAVTVTVEDRFLFDLQGYIVLRGAIDRSLCVEILKAVRAVEAVDYPDLWREKLPADKRAHRSKDTDVPHQIRLNGLARLDPIFDEVIAHPSYLPYLKEFLGDPQLVNTWCITKSKGVTPGYWHSGYGPEEYTFRNGVIRSPMLNVVTMLTPNTPGDGCLIVQPGSHKRNLDLPWDKYGKSGLEAPGAVEITGDVGDVVLFSESLNHNGSAKVNDGLRTNLYYNHMNFPRCAAVLDVANAHHYWMPPEVRARFTPERKHITRWMEILKLDE